MKLEVSFKRIHQATKGYREFLKLGDFVEKESIVKCSFLGEKKANLEAFGEMEEEMIQHRNGS